MKCGMTCKERAFFLLVNAENIHDENGWFQESFLMIYGSFLERLVCRSNGQWESFHWEDASQGIGLLLF